MSIILEIVRNILDTSFEYFDTATVAHAKKRFMDTIGCLIAGVNDPGCSMLRDLVIEWGGKEESTILVHGKKVPSHRAAMVNCMMARAFDFEPVGPYVDGKNTPGHISGTTVPTALSVAEHRGASGKDLLTALILGDDLASRINAASGFSLDHGWDCVGTANMFGATAIAGKLVGLNEHQMKNAFGTVVNQMGGSMQNFFDGAHAFKLIQGRAAEAGIVSAELAGRGFTGLSDPLFSKYGYFFLFCKSYQQDVLTKELGEKFYADNTFKPYPCCRANHASIESIMELVNKNRITPDDIKQVIIELPEGDYEFAIGQPFKVRETPQIDAAFSVQYNVANVLLRRRIELEHFTEEAIKDPEIDHLIKKINVEKLKGDGNSLSATIRVIMSQGDVFEQKVDIPKGDEAFKPMTDDEKKNKFRKNVAFSNLVSPENGEKILNIIKHMEDLEDIKELIKLLIP